jgi:hypothetical protein
VLLALRTMLGLDVVDGVLQVDPAPFGDHGLALEGVPVQGSRASARS